MTEHSLELKSKAHRPPPPNPTALSTPVSDYQLLCQKPALKQAFLNVGRFDLFGTYLVHAKSPPVRPDSIHHPAAPGSDADYYYEVVDNYKIWPSRVPTLQYGWFQPKNPQACAASKSELYLCFQGTRPHTLEDIAKDCEIKAPGLQSCLNGFPAVVEQLYQCLVQQPNIDTLTIGGMSLGGSTTQIFAAHLLRYLTVVNAADPAVAQVFKRLKKIRIVYNKAPGIDRATVTMGHRAIAQLLQQGMAIEINASIVEGDIFHRLGPSCALGCDPDSLAAVSEHPNFSFNIFHLFPVDNISYEHWWGKLTQAIGIHGDSSFLNVIRQPKIAAQTKIQCPANRHRIELIHNLHAQRMGRYGLGQVVSQWVRQPLMAPEGLDSTARLRELDRLTNWRLAMARELAHPPAGSGLQLDRSHMTQPEWQALYDNATQMRLRLEDFITRNSFLVSLEPAAMRNLVQLSVVMSHLADTLQPDYKPAARFVASGKLRQVCQAYLEQVQTLLTPDKQLRPVYQQLFASFATQSFADWILAGLLAIVRQLASLLQLNLTQTHLAWLGTHAERRYLCPLQAFTQRATALEVALADLQAPALPEPPAP